MMKQLLVDIVKPIVDNPDEFFVVERTSGDTTVLELTGAKSHHGKVIVDIN